MKVFKLSLAAVVATGAISSVGATMLEEAIKDIDVSGFGRYRYENRHNTRKENGEKIVTKNDNFHRFSLDVDFKATLDDNFFSVIGIRYDTKDVSGNSSSANKGISNTHGGLDAIKGWGGDGADSISIRKYYVGYKGIPDTIILAGRQEIGSFFTDEVVGTGLKVLNTSFDGLTFAAMAFDAIEDNGDVSYINDANGKKTGTNEYIFQNNFYNLATIYSNEWLNAQVWYAHLQNVSNLWAVDLDANYDVNDDFSLRGRINVAGSHFTHTMHRAYDEGRGSTLGNSIFTAINLGLTYDFVSLDAGYISYGKKDLMGFNSVDDRAHFIESGETALDYTEFTGKHNVWFGKINFKYNKYSLGLDYTYDKEKNSNSSVKTNEYTIRAGYKYSDKLNFKSYWAIENKKDGDKKDNNSRFRFEAKYSF